MEPMPLATLVVRGLIRPFDEQLARRLGRLYRESRPEPLLALALVSARVGEGDVCVELARFAGTRLAADLAPLPALGPWLERLRDSPLTTAGEAAPLVLDRHGRLYLARYWHQEQAVARALRARLAAPPIALDEARLRADLGRLFPPRAGIDWQRVAAVVAALRRFCVISGGPGTGKTRTVTSILALLLGQAGGTPPRIALAAPTGKAAARLSESIRNAIGGLALAPEFAAAIPQQATTLHRLLGLRPGRSRPRFGPHAPLHVDLVVVDEASMVDLPLMAHLLAALPESARLILLGDRDQLASVDPGRVLGDLCGHGRAIRYSPALQTRLARLAGVRLPPGPADGLESDAIVVLRDSYRFDATRGIGALARALQRGDGAAALALLDDPQQSEVVRLEPGPGVVEGLIDREVIPACRELLAADGPATALARFNQLRVLCALRDGPRGVAGINALIETRLRHAGCGYAGGPLAPGRPILVRVNDPAQGVYNGDVGLLWREAESGRLRAWFDAADGPRALLPSRLPAHETAFAMTVHRGQGSEFAAVLLLLPDHDSRVLTRELIYTAVTRAVRRVVVVATRAQILAAAARPSERASGLQEALWEDSRATSP